MGHWCPTLNMINGHLYPYIFTAKNIIQFVAFVYSFLRKWNNFHVTGVFIYQHHLGDQFTCRRIWALIGLDDAWWRHQMETFSALLALCEGNSPANIFKCLFLNETFCISIRISLNFVSKVKIDNKRANGSGNSLAPNRRQTITWTNADPVHRRIYAALRGDELTTYGQCEED